MPINLVTLLIAAVVIFSTIAGYAKGAASSANTLVSFILRGAASVASISIAWYASRLLSPAIQRWMVALQLEVPEGDIGAFKQFYYTVLTGIRDFSLFRFACLMIVLYLVVMQLFTFVIAALGIGHAKVKPRERLTVGSGLAGAGIGLLLGATRALILIAALFVYATAAPASALTAYVQSSYLYQQGSTQLITPITGDFVERAAPVFTRAVEGELRNILERKYEIIDGHIPDDIAEAAVYVTASASTPEEKAKALYEWVGTRVSYDYEKVRLYEEEDIWMEQTPEDTFRTRKGVCIDYSRLYAVMARAVGLEVKVVTGLGYDGKGGYGPHAWNEVYIEQRQQWVSLDTTWASSGGDWFGPERFADTHIKDA